MGQRAKNEEQCKNVIRDYIKDHKKNKTQIHSLRQIYMDIRELDKEGKVSFNISDKTFYRYAKDMNLQKIGDQQFDFVVDRPDPFSKMIFPREYNQILFYKLKDVSYGPLIVAKLNEYYSNFRKSFHCIMLGDMIACLYFNKEVDTLDTDKGKKNNSPHSLTSKEIRRDVKQCLKAFIITVTE